jgi:hypothetical protein
MLQIDQLETGKPFLPMGRKPIRWKDEFYFQQAVIKKRDELAEIEPMIGFLYTIQNAGEVGTYRDAGIVKGMPDLCLPVPSIVMGRWCPNLYIELKVNDGTLRKNQVERIALLRSVGNKVIIVWNYVDDVFDAIKLYLSGNEKARTEFL